MVIYSKSDSMNIALICSNLFENFAHNRLEWRIYVANANIVVTKLWWCEPPILWPYPKNIYYFLLLFLFYGHIINENLMLWRGQWSPRNATCLTFQSTMKITNSIFIEHEKWFFVKSNYTSDLHFSVLSFGKKKGFSKDAA